MLHYLRHDPPRLIFDVTLGQLALHVGSKVIDNLILLHRLQPVLLFKGKLYFQGLFQFFESQPLSDLLRPIRHRVPAVACS